MRNAPLRSDLIDKGRPERNHAHVDSSFAQSVLQAHILLVTAKLLNSGNREKPNQKQLTISAGFTKTQSFARIRNANTQLKRTWGAII